MLSRFQNPEVYVQEGYMFHRRCSLLLRCGLLQVQGSELCMLLLLRLSQLALRIQHVDKGRDPLTIAAARQIKGVLQRIDSFA